jgi:hypothetical protein
MKTKHTCCAKLTYIHIVYFVRAHNLGPMLGFLKNFRRKIFRKKLAFLTRMKGYFAEKVIITLVFEKNANFFAENRQKSQKTVII